LASLKVSKFVFTITIMIWIKFSDLFLGSFAVGPNQDLQHFADPNVVTFVGISHWIHASGIRVGQTVVVFGAAACFQL